MEGNSMQTAAQLRNQAAACRMAAKLARRPTRYLLDLAEQYEHQAAELDVQFSGRQTWRI
jgi:hypothetical protein